MFDGLCFVRLDCGIKHVWRACVPRLLSALTSTLAWLVTKQCLMMHIFGCQTFTVWAGLRAWTNDKCLGTKHHQTLFGDQTFYRLDTLFGAVWSCLIEFDRIWSCLIKFEGHQTFDQKHKTFLLFACLMGDVLFFWIKHVWCAHAYQACSAACINCFICVW